MSKEISITNGWGHVIVDDDIAVRLMGLKIFMPKQAGNTRPKVGIKDTKKGKTVYVPLARFIMNPAKREYVQHIDGVFTDCRRENMRIVDTKDEAGREHLSHERLMANPLLGMDLPDPEEDLWDRYLRESKTG